MNFTKFYRWNRGIVDDPASFIWYSSIIHAIGMVAAQSFVLYPFLLVAIFLIYKNYSFRCVYLNICRRVALFGAVCFSMFAVAHAFAGAFVREKIELPEYVFGVNSVELSMWLTFGLMVPSIAFLAFLSDRKPRTPKPQ